MLKTKRAVIIAWVIIAISIIGGFVITARASIFGDVPFSEIDWMTYFITQLPVIFMFFIITVAAKNSNKKEDDKAAE